MSICLQQNRKMLRSQPSLSTCLPNFLPKGLCADGIRAHCTVTIWITVARMIHCPIYEVICHFTSATDKILPKIINSQRFDKSCGGESYFRESACCQTTAPLLTLLANCCLHAFIHHQPRISFIEKQSFGWNCDFNFFSKHFQHQRQHSEFVLWLFIVRE